jgi:hypothetical protein
MLEVKRRMVVNCATMGHLMQTINRLIQGENKLTYIPINTTMGHFMQTIVRNRPIQGKKGANMHAQSTQQGVFRANK